MTDLEASSVVANTELQFGVNLALSDQHEPFVNSEQASSY